MKRKILSVLLALCMLLALMATPIAAAYQDTEGHWAEASIERWTGHGIVQGTENGFDPDGELTCAQLAAILARLLKLPEAPDAGFTDNPAEAWYYDSINRCAAAGILLGNGDGTVTPTAPITRERAIVMLSRALGIEPVENPDLSAFEDADAVADYAQGYVAALVAAGVIKGVTDETVGPQLNITRAATVAILDRAIAVYADTEGAEIDASEGGFILVAAENVVIKNAPAGTKVLVAPAAEDLTVNGKKVESDQTYIVPENKPTTPVHSHSYDTSKWVVDDTYHWHAANCGHDLTIDKAEHTFGDDNICTVCGQLKSSEAVAQINGKNYASLTAAIAAAVDGDTVTLVKDCDISNSQLVISASKSITLDLGGKVIKATNTESGNILVYGTLTLADSSDEAKDGSGTGKIYTDTVFTSQATGKCVINAQAGGTFIMESGLIDTASEIENNEDNGQFAVGMWNDTAEAKVVINGGKIKAGWYAVAGNGQSKTYDGEIIINGGILESVADYAIYLPHKGTTTINGGTIYGAAGGITIQRGTLKVNGGTITSKGTGSTGTWGDGTGGLDAAAVNVWAKYGTSTVEIAGGTFIAETKALFITNTENDGSISITGGTFSSDPSNYVAEGHAVYQNESGAYQVIKNEGEIEVTLSELKSVAVTKGPKAEGSETAVFTVDLGEQEIAAEDIAYSEVSSGYTGKGVLIGNTGLNSYGVRPANIGDYKFVITGGTINSAADGYSSIDGFANTSVYMLVPANSDVVFENVTFNGVFSFDVQKYTSPWSNLNSLTFKNCVFNGIIVGTCPASNITFDGCKFNSYTNASSANNSNPIWWREDTEGSGENANPIKTFTFVNNEVVGTRPVKIERIGKTVSPVFTIMNNTFDISSQEGDTVTKNMAINIGMGENPNLPFTLIDDGNTISANTAALYTASLTSGSNQYKEVSGMKVQDANGNPKTITAMVWKTTTGEAFELKSVD